LDKPKLRPLDAIPIRQGGRVVVQLYDPARISDKVLIVPQEMVFLLSLFDGTNTIPDIQAAVMRRCGELIFSEQIEAVLKQLDEALMLDSERFRTHLAAIAEEFRRMPLRQPASAGSAYPAEPGELAARLDGFFDADGGPGRPQPSRGAGRLVGLIAPHIDFERGGICYAHAYKALAEDCAADLYVVFGIAHVAQHAPFILTTKSFHTPLGTLKTSSDIVQALAERYGRDPFAEELVHRNEHSIEFQAVWLRHIVGDRPIEMLPVLCNSLDRSVGERKAPRRVPEIADFYEALREVVAASGRRACFIAAADLSHIGRQFGHDFDLTPQIMQDVEHADREMLGHVQRLDADGFYDSLRADGNARNVCGAPAIYALLATTNAARCDLLDYRQATDYGLQRSVTFAALALY